MIPHAPFSSWAILPALFRLRSVMGYALPLLLLFCLAWAVRQPMLRQMGYRWDTYTFEDWTTRVLREGLLNVYSEAGEEQGMSVNHPPLGLALLSAGRSLWAGDPGRLPPDQHAVDLNPDYIQALKLPIIAIDLLLIMVGYTYAYAVVPRRRSWWAIGIGAVLAFNPALLINSAWWGQTDGLLALFLVLTVIALHFRRLTLMWFFYALALLIKFQAALLFPLLLILTWRRQGWKGVLRGGIVSFMTVLFILIPIAVNSGLAGALRPYFGTVGQYPFVTVKAHNLWFWGLSSNYDLTGAWHTMPFDTHVGATEGIQIAGISARTVGFALFGLCVLWISIQAWRAPQRRDEFLLATALHMSFLWFPPKCKFAIFIQRSSSSPLPCSRTEH